MSVVSSVILCQTTKVILVALLLTEGLDRANTGHCLHEVLDEFGGSDSLLTVALIRSHLEPTG